MAPRPIDTSRLVNTEFARTLRLMREVGDPRLSMTLRVAWGDGWTKPVLAAILGVTRQAVQLRIRTAPFFPVDELPDIPPPPKRPEPAPRVPRVPKPEFQVGHEMSKHLRALYGVARTANGMMPTDHPAHQASEELSQTLATLVSQGAKRSTLARILNCSTQAISSRLAQYGMPRIGRPPTRHLDEVRS